MSDDSSWPGDPPVRAGAFDALTPDLVLTAVEDAFDLVLDGTIDPYPSYVNRVYGLRDDDAHEYIVKFYRPGRWSVDAIAAEHEFVLQCSDAEVPVVPPLPDGDGYTLQSVEVESAPDQPDAGRPGTEFTFALYKKRGGRGFDAERDDDWFRLGALAGRLHEVGRRGSAPERIVCTPLLSTARFVDELRAAAVVHPELSDEFFAVADGGVSAIAPLFDGVEVCRIHGDFHRGNVLERADEGLVLIDFDDMMSGPPVQDLWLLLPDHAHASRRQLTHILDGYEQFAPFDRSTLGLIEPLRFMRMIYYLAWSALQRDDNRFVHANPDWGTRAFWIQEVEDLRTQLGVIKDDASE